MSWSEPRFDEHAFAKRTKAVVATPTADGWDSPGISFQDFGSMRVLRRSNGRVRRLPTPEWAVRDDLLREILLLSAENRMYIRNHAGTDEERMARIDEEQKKRVVEKERVLARMIQRHVVEKDPYTKHRLEINIQAVDSEIVLLKRGLVQTNAAVCYLYYRLRWDTVTVAEKLGIKSPYIRVTLARMHILAEKFGLGDKQWDTNELNQLHEMIERGVPVKECAQVFGVSRCAIYGVWRRSFPGERIPRRCLDLRVPRVVQGHARKYNKQEIVNLVAQGKSFAEVTAAIGCSDRYARWVVVSNAPDLYRRRTRTLSPDGNLNAVAR